MPDQDALPAQKLDTRSLPEDRQFRAWNAAVIGLACLRDGKTKQPFHAGLRQFRLPRMMLAKGWQMHGCTLVRNHRRISADTNDSICLHLLVTGREAASSFPGHPPLQRGQIRLLDFAQPFEVSLGPMESYITCFDRKLFDDDIYRLDRLHGSVLQPGSLTDMLKTHLQTAFEALRRADAFEQARIAEMTVHLVKDVLASSTLGRTSLTGYMGPSGSLTFADAAGLLSTIKMYVLPRLDQGGLDPAALARHMGVSRSTFYALCKPLGSPAALIQHVRLQEAVRLMRKNPASRIADIATATGFKHRETFSRVFQHYFGLSPSRFQQKVKRERVRLTILEPLDRNRPCV